MNENAPTATTDAELTEEQRTRIAAWLAAHPYGEQDENGIDIGSIRRNLRLTPTQRLRRLEEGASQLLRMRHARNIH